MDLNSIVEIINTVGFPIVVSIVLYVTYRDVVQYQREVLDEFRKTINHNTSMISKLIDKLEAMESRNR